MADTDETGPLDIAMTRLLNNQLKVLCREGVINQVIRENLMDYYIKKLINGFFEYSPVV